jgi:hypothetical protein
MKSSVQCSATAACSVQRIRSAGNPSQVGRGTGGQKKEREPSHRMTNAACVQAGSAARERVEAARAFIEGYNMALIVPFVLTLVARRVGQLALYGAFDEPQIDRASLYMNASQYIVTAPYRIVLCSSGTAGRAAPARFPPELRFVVGRSELVQYRWRVYVAALVRVAQWGSDGASCGRRGGSEAMVDRWT